MLDDFALEGSGPFGSLGVGGSLVMTFDMLTKLSELSLGLDRIRRPIEPTPSLGTLLLIVWIFFKLCFI